MVVRGAPAIAISAALGLAVEIQNKGSFASVAEAKQYIEEKLDFLVTRLLPEFDPPFNFCKSATNAGSEISPAARQLSIWPLPPHN